MKKNITYKKAAIKIANNEEKLCCLSLDSWDERLKFAELFKPSLAEMEFTRLEWFGSCLKPKNQLARSLALLFMYEMGE